jgi:hypothetical protein
VSCYFSKVLRRLSPELSECYAVCVGAHLGLRRAFLLNSQQNTSHTSAKGRATAASISLSYTTTLLHNNSFCFYAISWTELASPHAVLTVNYTHYVGPCCFRPRATPDIMPAERGRSAQHEPTLRVVATEATSERSSHQRHFFWTTLELCCTFSDELTSSQTV